jgi:pimeloyl-ACP methyl ester carboxylesterase
VTIFLAHHKTQLALHSLRRAEGPRLLLLHALGEHSPDTVPGEIAGWPGAVYALDFTGHGQSSVPAGGGYTSEVLMGDADAALAMIGEATILGWGLGAYVALMIAAGRPKLVRGAILADGSGLSGGGDVPGVLAVRGVHTGHPGAPDPFALVELSSDLRPRDYAADFARIAHRESGLDVPISVVAAARPDWLAAVVEQEGVRVTTLDEALGRYAEVRREK